MGESVNGGVVSNCHQCGQVCDTHVNCANEFCHILFIQCPDCAKKYDQCCSDECAEVKNASHEGKEKFRIDHGRKFGNSKAYRKSYRLIKNSNFAGTMSNKI